MKAQAKKSAVSSSPAAKAPEAIKVPPKPISGSSGEMATLLHLPGTLANTDALKQTCYGIEIQHAVKCLKWKASTFDKFTPELNKSLVGMKTLYNADRGDALAIAWQDAEYAPMLDSQDWKELADNKGNIVGVHATFGPVTYRRFSADGRVQVLYTASHNALYAVWFNLAVESPKEAFDLLAQDSAQFARELTKRNNELNKAKRDQKAAEKAKAEAEAEAADEESTLELSSEVLAACNAAQSVIEVLTLLQTVPAKHTPMLENITATLHAMARDLGALVPK